MFILASQRSDFTQAWENVFRKRGDVSVADSLDKLHDVLLSSSAKLVMLDLALPGSRDPAQLRSLQLACNKAKLLLGGIAFEPSSELAGLAVGASACLDQSLTPEACEKIIDVVLQGGIWLSSASIPVLVNKLESLPVVQRPAKESPAANAIAEENLRKLTPREREVAHMVGNGANNKTIARALNITDRTVKAHLTSIFEKLNISDRLQLALRVSTREQAAEPASEQPLR